MRERRGREWKGRRGEGGEGRRSVRMKDKLREEIKEWEERERERETDR